MMQTVDVLLHQAKKLGIDLRTDGSRVWISPKDTAPSPKLIAEMKRFEPQLVRVLSRMGARIQPEETYTDEMTGEICGVSEQDPPDAGPRVMKFTTETPLAFGVTTWSAKTSPGSVLIQHVMTRDIAVEIAKSLLTAVIGDLLYDSQVDACDAAKELHELIDAWPHLAGTVRKRIMEIVRERPY